MAGSLEDSKGQGPLVHRKDTNSFLVLPGLGLAVPGFIGLRVGAGFLGSGVCGFH